MSMLAIGIDFGTTGAPSHAPRAQAKSISPDFRIRAISTDVYRSLLYLEQVKERGASRIKSWSGPTAIEEYLSAETKGRLVQSLKSFLTSRSLKSTDVFGRRMTIEELDRPGSSGIFGKRPRFSLRRRFTTQSWAGRYGSSAPIRKSDNSFGAEQRLRAAFKLADTSPWSLS